MKSKKLLKLLSEVEKKIENYTISARRDIDELDQDLSCLFADIVYELDKEEKKLDKEEKK